MPTLFPNWIRLAGTCLLSSVAAHGQVVYVNANLSTGANDGSSWADACQGPLGLQDALGSASAGNVLWVAGGRYYPEVPSGSRIVSFDMLPGVGLFGGFVGTEANLSQRPPAGTVRSILSGDLNGDDGLGMRADNSRRVVSATGIMNVRLDRFTITGGVGGFMTSLSDDGGGLFMDLDGNVNVTDCEFLRNRSQGQGAGFFSLPGFTTCTFQGCLFEGNLAQGDGGAVSAACRNLTFQDCEFLSNVSGSSGGAIRTVVPGELRVSGTRFDGNTSGGSGGALSFVGPGAHLVEGSTFIRNSAAGGGALHVDIGSMGQFTASNCLVVRNAAAGADGGGGVFLRGFGAKRFRACTVAENSASSQAQGGIRNAGSLQVEVQGSVLWGNTSAGVGSVSSAQVSSGVTVLRSVVQGGFLGGSGVLDVDPAFENAPDDDFRLGAASPCIDAGDNSFLKDAQVVDALGQPRFRDDRATPDTGVGSGHLVDLGAIEFQGDYVGFPVCSSVPNSTGAVGLLDALGSAEVAQNSVTLLATDLPPNQFTLALLGGPLWGPQSVPGSIGTLCLIGPPLGRFQNQIQMSDAAGEAAFALNLAALPGPSGTFAVAPGDTHVFQAWHRDGGAGAPSNFTRAVRISFE